MNKKKIIILLSIIALVLIVVIGIKIGLDFHKESIIKEDIRSINNAIINYDESFDINSILETRKINSGHYKAVEDAIKTYYTDLYNNLKNIAFLLDSENEYNYLDISNIKSDGPTFTKSKDMISNTKAQIDDYYNLFLKYLTNEDLKLNYIADKKLDRYYVNFYLELTSEINDEVLKNNLATQYEKAINKLDIYEEAIDYLIINKSTWTIKNNTITFNKTEYYTEYNKITNKLNEGVTE